MVFVLKSVNPSDHIGPDLIELRTRLGWDRKTASEHTKLTESFIASLEEEQWDEIGDPIYAERMVKAYVRILGGNETYFLQKYRGAIGDRRLAKQHKDDRKIKPMRIQILDLMVGSRILAMLAFIVFVGFLGWYVFRQARAISAPPAITVEEPAEGAQLDQPNVNVKGKTSPDESVFVNGRQAIVEPDGAFHVSLDIPRGTTMIVVSARKRHGEETVVIRHIVYDRPLPTVSEAPFEMLVSS